MLSLSHTENYYKFLEILKTNNIFFSLPATIVVLANAHVNTIQSYGESLQEGTKDQNVNAQTDQIHESIFMLLQIINGLKCFQARGIEELPEALTSFVVLKESHCNGTSTEDRLSSLSAPKTNSYGRLCILQGYV